MNEEEFSTILCEHLYAIADVLMEYYDCCHIVNGTCKAGDPTACCTNALFGKGICPFWDGDICNNKNLDCRTWLCETAIQSTDPKCIETLKLVEKIADLYGLVMHPFIGEPYHNGADRLWDE